MDDVAVALAVDVGVYVKPGVRRLIARVSVALTRDSISSWEAQTRATVISGRPEMS